jgi:hypothetical protein
LNSTGSASVNLSGASGNVRDFAFSTNNLGRWILRADNTTESGANAGSDFNIVGRDDSGVALGTYMFIRRSTGEVGIGTTNPVEKLSVNGAIQIGNTGNANSGSIKFDGTDFWFRKGGSWVSLAAVGAGDNLGNHMATNNIQLGTFWLSGDGGSEGIRVDTSGKVGIGTGTPGELLDVKNSSGVGRIANTSLYPEVVLDGAAGGVSGGKKWTLHGNSGGGNSTEAGFFRISNNTGTYFAVGATGKTLIGLYSTTADLPQSMLDVKGGVAVGTYASTAAAPTDGLIVSGNTGIGTSSPNEKLTVDGVTSLRAVSAPSSTANYGKLYVDSGDSNKLKYMNPAGTVTDLTATGGGADNLGNHTATMNIRLGSNWLSGDGGAEGISVDANGFVGVGSVPDATSLLYVQGQIKSNDSVKVDWGGTTNPLFIGRAGGFDVFEVNALTGYGQMSLRDNAGTTKIRFDANNANASYIAGGNFGIGTLTPSQKLDVAGSANIQDGLTVGSSAVFNNVIYANGGIQMPMAGGVIGQGAGATGDISILTTNNRNINLIPNGTGAVNVSNTKIINVATATAGTDAANKDFVDNAISAAAGNYVQKSGDTMTGQLTVSGGSASAPSLAVSGSGSGIWSPTPSELAFSGAGVERMRITGSGYIGIGTQAPLQELHLKGSLNNSGILMESNTGGATDGAAMTFRKSNGTSAAPTIVGTGDEIGQIGFDAYDGFSYSMVAGIFATMDGTVGAGDLPTRLEFATSADGTAGPATRMTIKNSGNVGIGVTSPSAILHLKAGTAAPNSAPLKFSPGANMTAVENGTMEYDGTDYWLSSGGTRKKIATSANGSTDFVAKTGDTMSGALAIGLNSGSTGLAVTQAGAGHAATFMGGNVGIGTTAPNAPLHVVQDSGINVGDHNLLSLSRGNGSDNAGLDVFYGANGSNTTGVFLRARNDQPLFIGTETTKQALNIVDNGNVGIGTAGPSTKLEVSGSGTIVKLNGGAGSAGLDISGASGNGRDLSFSTGANGRWNLRTDNTAEGGANSGSDFNLVARNDAGSLIGTYFFVKRDTGNVGIGTDVVAPGSKLEIKGAGTTSGTSALNVTDSSGASKLFVRNDGNVGVGTTSPTSSLHVRKDLAAGFASAAVENTVTNGYAGFSVKGDSRSYTMFVGGSAAGTMANKFGIMDASAGQYRLIIDSAGNVGIWNPSPSALLDIGLPGSTNGNLRLASIGGGSVFMQAPNTVASVNFTLPNSNGTGGQVLQTDGTGMTSWTSVPSDGGTFLATTGTAFAPGFSFNGAGNTDNGMYLINGTDALGFATAGSSRMAIEPSGSISISGAGGASHSLYFSNTTNHGISVDRPPGTVTSGRSLIVSAGGSSSGSTNLNGGNLTLASGIATGTGSSNLYFQTATPGSSGTVNQFPTTKMMIAGIGNVGIGTNAPSNPLSFGVNNTSLLGIGVERQPVTTSPGVNFIVSAGGAPVGGTDKAGGNLTLASGMSTGLGSSSIYFQTAPPAGSSSTTDQLQTTKMIIDGTGNVGIGGMAPITPLHIAVSKVSATEARIENTNTSSASSVSSVELWGNSGGTQSAIAALIAYPSQNSSFMDGNPLSKRVVLSANQTGGGLNLAAPNGDIQLYAGTGAYTERMRISSSGNVGIGTISPNAKLHVQGAIVSKENAPLAGVTTVDFSTGNSVVISSISGGSPLTLTLNGMQPGGSYTLLITDSTARSYNFGGSCTTVKGKPSNQPFAVTGGHSIFSIMYLNNTCYVSWSTGWL